MKNNLIIIISAIAALALGSCAGSGGVQQGMRQDYYSQGFYYGNRYYDPRFYNFTPRGNRIIIIDNRTDEPVASPSRRQVEEARDVRRQSSSDSPARQRSTVRESRNADTRSREQVAPRRTRRSNPVVSPQRNQGNQERAAPAPRQQNRNPESRSRRGGN